MFNQFYGYVHTPMWCADGLCSLSYVLCLRMRCLSVSWWVQKLQGVAERSWERFRIITTVSMEKRKQKVTGGENQIKGKVITGLTSAGSVSVCPGCPWSFSWWIWNHRCVFVCVRAQTRGACIFKQCVVLSGCAVLWGEFCCAFGVGKDSS